MVLSGMLVFVNVNKEKKSLKLTAEQECEEISDKTTQNKTISITKYVENCKPFVTSSALFLAVSVILTGIVVCFYVKSNNRNFLPY